MYCPFCSDQALTVVATVNGQLARCPSCEGLFVPWQMLAHFSEDSEGFLAALNQTRAFLFPTGRVCPQCLGRLSQGRLPEQDGILTLCFPCQRIWTDIMELEQWDNRLAWAVRMQIEKPTVPVSMDAAPKELEPPPFAFSPAAVDENAASDEALKAQEAQLQARYSELEKSLQDAWQKREQELIERHEQAIRQVQEQFTKSSDNQLLALQNTLAKLEREREEKDGLLNDLRQQLERAVIEQEELEREQAQREQQLTHEYNAHIEQTTRNASQALNEQLQAEKQQYARHLEALQTQIRNLQKQMEEGETLPLKPFAKITPEPIFRPVVPPRAQMPPKETLKPAEPEPEPEPTPPPVKRSFLSKLKGGDAKETKKPNVEPPPVPERVDEPEGPPPVVPKPIKLTPAPMITLKPVIQVAKAEPVAQPDNKDAKPSFVKGFWKDIVGAWKPAPGKSAATPAGSTPAAPAPIPQPVQQHVIKPPVVIEVGRPKTPEPAPAPTPAPQPVAAGTQTKQPFALAHFFMTWAPRVMPVIAFLISYSIDEEPSWAFLWGLIIWSVFLLVRLKWLYPKEFTNTSVGSLPSDLSEGGRGLPVTILGHIEEPRTKPLRFGDATGTVNLNVLNMLEIVPHFFGVLNAAQFPAGEFVLKGWYRLGKLSSIEVHEITQDKLVRKSLVRTVRWSLAWFMLVFSILLLIMTE